MPVALACNFNFKVEEKRLHNRKATHFRLGYFKKLRFSVSRKIQFKKERFFKLENILNVLFCVKQTMNYHFLG